MPLPIAHSLIGASIVAASYPNRTPRENWKSLIVGAALATAPDLDLLVIWLFNLNRDWHRGFTHSLFFAVLVGLLIYVFKGRQFLKEAILFGLVVLSHGLFDALVSIKGGVGLLWPFSHRFAFGLFEYPDTLAFSYYPGSDALIIKGLYGVLVCSLYELIFCGSFFLLILGMNRILRDRQAALRK